MSINPSLFPYILKNKLIRRYESIELFDFETDDSYDLNEEAYSILQLINGSNSEEDIINRFPYEKQEQVKEALKEYYNLKIIEFSSEKKDENKSELFNSSIIPKKNLFNQPYLRTLMVNITEKCNLRCDHCYVTDKHQTDFPLEKFKPIIEEFFKLQGLKLVLTGGEPFLYSSFKELLEYLKDIPLQKIILSNGVLIKDHIDLLDLIKNNINEIYVSIDGLKDAHNEIRNADCFQKTVEGIKILLENNIKVSINTMLHKQNLMEFEALEKFIKNLGNISSWIIDIPTFDDTIPLTIKEKYGISPEEAKTVFGKFG